MATQPMPYPLKQEETHRQQEVTWRVQYCYYQILERSRVIIFKT